jgi:ferritin-like metal-binding protein YciE
MQAFNGAPSFSSRETAMISAQFTELLLQSLEHERGGVKVYTAALKCAQRPDLHAEWQEYLSQTEEHVEALTNICEVFDVDPFTTTPGTQIVKALGTSLVEAMNTALAAGDPAAAQIVAAECVVLAETKDHLDWELLGEASKSLGGDERQAVQDAYEKIEDEEDEHLYHTQGWCRELWMESLGLPAELPPPEEKQDVTTAAEAQYAKEMRQPRH